MSPFAIISKLLELISECSNIIGFKVNIQKSVVPPYPRNKHLKKFRTIYDMIQKYKILECKFHKRFARHFH